MPVKFSADLVETAVLAFTLMQARQFVYTCSTVEADVIFVEQEANLKAPLLLKILKNLLFSRLEPWGNIIYSAS